MRLQTHVCSVVPTLTVAVGGELDIESGPCLRDQLTCMIRAIGPRLALDLTGVTFIDCSGLTALLTARKAAQARGGWLRLVAVSRCVGRLVQITGLQDALRVARREAATAIATCMACPVRAQCLELSLRHWDIGQHGVWGGLIPADRRNCAVACPTQRAE